MANGLCRRWTARSWRGLLVLSGLGVVLAGAGTTAAAPASNSGSGASQDGPTVAVSLGDSFISGEGGRWQGNIAMQYTTATDMWGTDRACSPSGPCSPKDPKRVYGESYLNPDTRKEDGCHRSDVAEIHSSRPARRILGQPRVLGGGDQQCTARKLGR